KVQELLAQCAEEERYLEGVEQQIAQAEEWETLEAVALELSASGRRGASPSQGTLTPRPLPVGEGAKSVALPTAAALPYRTFVLRDGSTLYCGKHNQGNDVLLRQVATPEDLWLHAYQQAGAHVVLKVRPGHEVSHQTLLQAAALAAFFSKGKDAASVAVMYT